MRLPLSFLQSLIPDIGNFISLLRSSLRSPDVGIASYIRTFVLTIHLSLSYIQLSFPTLGFVQLHSQLVPLLRDPPVFLPLSIYAIPQLSPSSPSIASLTFRPTFFTIPGFAISIIELLGVTSAFDPKKQPHIFVCQTESISLDSRSFFSIIDVLQVSSGFTCLGEALAVFGHSTFSRITTSAFSES